MTDKTTMRVAARARRQNFFASDTKRPEIPAPKAFLATLDRRMIVASYRSIGSEASPTGIERAVQHQGCVIAYPRIDSADAPLSFRLASGSGDWERGPHGIAQPGAHSPLCTPTIAIVPLLAFDRRGNRLGQGGGYYDRTALAMPQMTLYGLAWSIQEVGNVPHDAHDRRLRAIITEREWIWIEA